VRDGGGWSVCVLNRKGRARLLACVACGELARCERCGATVAQEETGVLACPQCAASRPAVCLACHGSRFRAVKPGVTKVRDDLAALLPRASVVAVEGATVDASALDAELRGADVLIGTEAALHRAATMVGGSVRPRPGLVAFLEFDQELLAPRARAAEQALWLLVRASRLVGPRAERGEVLVQTRLTDHEVVRAAATSDPVLVAEAEAARRRVLGYPPFGGLAEVSGDPAAVAAACDALRELTVAASGVGVLGPIADGKRALVRAPTMGGLCDALAGPGVAAARTLGRLRVDVDPRRV
jgi:primosomal protein N' (replication factor Y)